jgi:hypothetical protein
VRFLQLPTTQLVPREAVERLQRKFTESKTDEERARFWAAVQARKQPTVDFERGIPIG